MIYEVDGVFSRSGDGVWLSGLFATSAAARYAFQFSEDEIHDLWENPDAWEWADGKRVPNSRAPITTDDLRALRAARAGKSR